MLKRLFVFLVLSCLCSSFAMAQNAPTLGEAIVEFLNARQSKNTKQLTPDETEAAIVRLVREASEALFTFDEKRMKQAVIDAKKQDELADDPDLIRAILFVEKILDVLAVATVDNRNTELINFFDSYDSSNDWFLESVSHSLSAFLSMSQNQLLIGTEHVNSAMKVIPSELSHDVTAARILASDIAMVLHGLQGKPEFMLEAAKLQKTAKASIGEEIDYYELMTNFIYALNRARDYESAALVVELLLEEPRPETAAPGVSEAYMAATFNEIGDYQRAEKLADTAVNSTKHAAIIQRGNLELLVALAGQDKARRAVAFMRSNGWKYRSDELMQNVDSQSILHAEALLAMHRNESEYALALMKRRADLIINQVQSANSADINAMLSNLENTRERQVERETALQREAEMRAVQLEQKSKLNRLLWVLIAGLTIAFNLLLAFLRYREKLNVKVQGLQEDALSAEKMKTEFLSLINHELRTPLNGIIGISDAMIHNAPTAMMREQAEIVQKSGQTLFDLIESLITMSTIESGRLSLDKDETELSATLTQEIPEWIAQSAEKGLTFTHFIGTELDEVIIADHKRIRQSLRYLMSNAIRFTHSGRVHLHATGESDDEGALNVTIIVADTGQGISDEVQERLFKPFLQADATMTRKYGGAGLSLAIARKIARMMDGDITVKSREGRGSEFTFTMRLPIAQNASQESDGRESPSDMSGIANIDAPEELIDLMLNKQLAALKSPKKPPLKEAS